VVETSHGGPGHARNAGARVARGRILAFLDDDVRAEPGWLEAAIAHFAAPDVGGVEGATVAELGDDSLYIVNLANTDGGRYPTCNMFYLRAAFEAVGGFDERFQRTREDADIAFRVLDAGYRLVFEPAARVAHRSHHASVWMPIRLASQLTDSVLLWAKHPGRDSARPGFYRSDVAKIALLLLAPLLAAAGWRLGAAACLAAALALALRTMLSEVVLARVARPDRFLALVAVYLAAPFANLYYLVKGRLRVRRLGVRPERSGT